MTAESCLTSCISKTLHECNSHNPHAKATTQEQQPQQKFKSNNTNATATTHNQQPQPKINSHNTIAKATRQMQNPKSTINTHNKITKATRKCKSLKQNKTSAKGCGDGNASTITPYTCGGGAAQAS